MANSTAEMPRSSRARPPSLCRINSSDRKTPSSARFMTVLQIRFVTECNGGHDKTFTTRRVGQIEAEQRYIDRPLVHQADHHDVAGTARVIAEVAGLQIAAPIDRALRVVDGGE